MADKPVAEIEEWRAIPGHPGYEASSLGRVRSVDRWITNSLGRRYFYRGAIVRPVVQGGKYHVLNMGPAKAKRVNVIICSTFHGPQPSKLHQAAHGNGNRYDNRAANLRWATPKENTADQDRHGTRPIGTGHWKAKLSEADIRAIRKMRSSGASFPAISKRFGIAVSHAHRITAKESWKHLG